jgi:molybdenum cofactor guanylyltransferase
MTLLHGLVLAGGRSTRMRADKAALRYGPVPELARAYELLQPRVRSAWISVRAEQAGDPLRARFPQILDGADGKGPAAGILSAMNAHPHVAWLVLACDLPLLDGATLDELVAGRDERRLATAFVSASDSLPEPLCAIYEPASRAPLGAWVAAGRHCPRKFLMAHDVALLVPARPAALGNANTPDELTAARTALSYGSTAR